MRFILYMFVGLASITAAQTPDDLPNVFINPPAEVAVGNGVDLTWGNTHGINVTIQLRQGSSGNLGVPQTIASMIENTGSYVWHVPDGIVSGSDYVLEIIDEDDTSLTSYSPQFSIASPLQGSGAASAAAASSTHKSFASSMSSTSFSGSTQAQLTLSKVPITSSTATSSAPSDATGLPEPAKIGIGVGVGVGGASLIGVIAYLIFRLSKQRREHRVEMSQRRGREPGVSLG